MKNTEKLCLKRNDFQENISTAFGSMRIDANFADVTLACEDGKQIEAHKVILAASSPFFQNLLTRNQHAHPLIYMRGVQSETLEALVDFLYHGEANVYQETLNDFLTIAEELKLKGLLNNEDKTDEDSISTKEFSRIKELSKNKTSMEMVEETKFKHESFLSDFQEQNEANEMGVALRQNMLNDLDSQIKSMMSTGSKIVANGKKAENTCRICGKDGSWNTIRDHIELHHIARISHPCNLCGKAFR